jgi:hypothetical protein
MKFACAFSLALVLLAPAAASAQTAADRSWPGFWRQFTSAVRGKNRAAIRRLMSSEADFITTGGIGNRNDFLKMFDDKSYWGDVRRSADQGVVSFVSEKGRPGRRTRDKYLTFEFIGGRWRFVGLFGD